LTSNSLKKNFIHSFCIIIVIIGISEALIMLLLDKISFLFTSIEVVFIDVTLLVLLSFFPLWFFALRPLSMQIIEEKRMNTQLLEALGTCNEVILLVDNGGRVYYANEAVYKTTGWTAAELLGKNISVLNAPNVNKKTLKELENCLRQNKPWFGRLLARRKGMEQIKISGQTTAPDPLEYWMEVDITPILKEGRKNDYTVVLHDVNHLVEKENIFKMEKEDVTARITIANILQQSIPLKQRFVKVLNILFTLKDFELENKGGIFLKTEDENFLDMFVLEGKFSEEFIRKEKRVALGACLCGRAAVSGKMIISDDCFCDPDHEHQFNGMKAHGHYIVPLLFHDNILGVLFLYTSPYPTRSETRMNIFIQIGEMMALALLREKTQQSLSLAHETALQAAKDKSGFLAKMSHEIRTPMNGILGMLDILKDTEMTHEQRDMVQTTVNSANSLLIILNDILNFSKLEVGKVELENREFDLPHLVKDICSLMALGKENKKLDINYFLATKLQPYWLGDEVRIRQILTNLLGNAIKFTNTGEIFVNVKLAKSNQQESQIRFEIQDTGIGISPEIQKNLFQPFTQADSSTARHFGGTGLGLSICKELVELMGGKIGVESELGKGALFWFTLPLQLSDRTVATTPDEVNLPDYSDYKILVAEDNKINQKVILSFLKRFNIKVDLVENGQLVLEKLAIRKYDLVFMDCQMPIMDGYEATRKLRKNDLTKMDGSQLPIIALTANASEGDKEKCLGAGMDDYLAKPIEPALLADILSKWLGQSD